MADQELNKLMTDVSTVLKQTSAAKEKAREGQQAVRAVEQAVQSAEQQLQQSITALSKVEQRFDKIVESLQKEYEAKKAELEREHEEKTEELQQELSEPLTFFSGLFSEHFDTKPDQDGEIFIDRNSDHFGIILDHLRNGGGCGGASDTDSSSVTVERVKSLDAVSRKELQREVEYYQVRSLLELMDPKPKPKEESNSVPKESAVGVVLHPVWANAPNSKTVSNNVVGFKSFLATDGFDANDGVRREFSVRVDLVYNSHIYIGVATVKPQDGQGYISQDGHYLGQDANGWSYHLSGYKYHGGNASAYPTRYSADATIKVVLPGNGTIEFEVNGSNGGVMAFGNVRGTVYPAVTLRGTGINNNPVKVTLL